MAPGIEDSGTREPPRGNAHDGEGGGSAPRAEGGDPSSGGALTDEALLAECRVETFTAGGPGGQHQNRTESAVRLTHVPTGISVVARESRSQHRNRKTALARLRAALEELARPETPRVPTKVPARAKRKRLEEKRRRSQLKRRRKEPGPDD